MNTSFTNRIAQRLQEKDVEQPGKEPREPISDGTEVVESTAFYEVVRISSSLVNLHLYLADGTRAAVPCSYMTGYRFNSSEITFRADGEKYTITGRNLEKLWTWLVDQRLKSIKANIGNDLTPERDLFVKEITIAEL